MESADDLPFRYISLNIYLLLEVMMHVDHEDALKFMFNINKKTRKLLISNFTTLRNGFMNDGLIDICFSDDPDEQFNNYD